VITSSASNIETESESIIGQQEELPVRANVDGTPFLEDETLFAKHAQLTRSSS
jgi:hypothetical protein